MQDPSEKLGNNPRLGEALQTFMRQQGIEPGRMAGVMHGSEQFREICADYEECCAKLFNLDRKGTTADRELHDYLELRDQLERELLRCLRVADPQHGRATRLERTKHE